MAPKAMQTLTHEKLCEFLKDHVPDGVANEKYLKADQDHVCKDYNGFLVAVASCTMRLNKKSVQRAAMHVFECSLPEAKMFGQQMETCIAHCRSKASQATTGAKLSPWVVNVVKAFSTCGLVGSPSPSASPSPSPSRAEAQTNAPNLAKLQTYTEIQALYGIKNVETPCKSDDTVVDLISSQEIEDESQEMASN